MLRKMSSDSVKLNLELIRNRIDKALSKRSIEGLCTVPTLVAVSKIKPAELICEAYDAGQRHFGENYVKEMYEKGTDRTFCEKCPDIKWHFIGNLQRNKVNKLITIPGLYMVETVDSIKLAETLDNAWAKKSGGDTRLKIMLQVNTSGEDEKHGMSPEDVVETATLIKEKCPNLQVEGLMTIGKYGYDTSLGPNPDFLSLIECRDRVCQAFGLHINDLALSMGMSNDFEQAIEMGSSYVRVGTSIFGERHVKMKDIVESD